MTRAQLVMAAIAMGLLACGSGRATEQGGTMADGSPGRSVYNMNCSLCHGRDGTLGLNGAKDLGRSTLSRSGVAALVRSGKGAMMPYKDVLSAKELEAVVDYVLTLRKAE